MGLKNAVDGFVGNDHGAALQPDTAAGAYPKKHGVHDFGVEHEFDDFVQKNTHRRHAHSVLKTKKPFTYTKCHQYSSVRNVFNDMIILFFFFSPKILWSKLFLIFFTFLEIISKNAWSDLTCTSRWIPIRFLNTLLFHRVVKSDPRIICLPIHRDVPDKEITHR